MSKNYKSKIHNLVKEISLEGLDLNFGTKFYDQVINNPEFKIQKIAEWELRDDRKFQGTKKPKATYIADDSLQIDDYKDTVVYFFVVEKSCLYIGQTSTSINQRMAAYASAGRTQTDDGKFIPSGDNRGGATNKKINSKVTAFKLANSNDTIKIYSAFYKVPESIQLLPDKGQGILSGEFNIVISPTKVEKYYIELFKSIEGSLPKWQSNIDDSIYRPN